MYFVVMLSDLVIMWEDGGDLSAHQPHLAFWDIVYCPGAGIQSMVCGIFSWEAPVPGAKSAVFGLVGGEDTLVDGLTVLSDAHYELKGHMAITNDMNDKTSEKFSCAGKLSIFSDKIMAKLF